MKRVSFNVAKALKDAGYPQGQTDKVYIDADCYDDKVGTLVEHPENYWEGDIVDAPYVMAVWLWLWREKNLHIYHDNVCDMCFICDENIKDYEHNIVYSESYTDPEEAIIAAIEYLVDNKLLK